MEESQNHTPPEQTRTKRLKAKNSSQKGTTAVKSTLKGEKDAYLISLFENLKAIFQRQYQKNIHLRQKYGFQGNVKRFPSQGGHFSQLLTICYDKNRLKTGIYFQLITELSKMIKQSCKSILECINQQELKEYQGIVEYMSNLFKIMHSEQANRATLSKSRYIKSVIEQDLTIQKVIKLDALSYFLKKNQYYEAVYGTYMQATVIQPQGFFNQAINKQYITIENILKYITLSLANIQQFEDIVNLTSLIELKYRIINKERRDKETVELVNQFDQRLIRTKQIVTLKEDQGHIQFKYSQFAFLLQGKDAKELKQVVRLTQALSIDFRDILEEENIKQYEKLQLQSKQIDKMEKKLTHIFEQEKAYIGHLSRIRVSYH